MAILQKAALRKHLKTEPLAGVYLLYGPETYLRGLAAKTIADFAIKNSELREFNEAVFSLNDVPLVEALASAEQLPIGDERRVITITEFFLSGNPHRSSLKENAGEVLEQYLGNPSDSSVVVFVADEFDRRLKLSKLFQKTAITVEFKPLATGEVGKWVHTKLRESGAEADERTINRIIGLVGDDAGKLEIEIQKLATAALPETVITPDLVERLVKHTRIHSNFELTDHLVAGRREAAIAAMRKILDDGAEPLMLLGLLSYNFRQLFIAKELMNKGFDRGQVVSEMGLRGRPDRLLAAARRADQARLERVLKRIAETDLAIKTSVGTPRLQIEMLVCELSLA